MSLGRRLNDAFHSGDVRRTQNIAASVIESSGTDSGEFEMACEALAACAEACGNEPQEKAWEMAARGIATSTLSTDCGSVGREASDRISGNRRYGTPRAKPSVIC